MEHTRTYSFITTMLYLICKSTLIRVRVCVCVCRRENELKLPQGWIYYLAPEIVQKMRPGQHEDCLPFSNAADVYAFG